MEEYYTRGVLDESGVKELLEDFSATDEAGVLTADMWERAFAELRDRPVPPTCGSEERPHIVHPRAKGWTRCANCLQPLMTEGLTCR